MSTIRARLCQRHGGFALVITMSLVVLLMVVAVGLLSLSSMALRTGSAAAARDKAMSNARLAMLVAVGELQRRAGPDQRITAPAALKDAAASPGLTGVWEASPNNPDRSPDYAQRWSAAENPTPEPDGEFLGWLASESGGARWNNPSAPPALTNPAASAVPLLSRENHGNGGNSGLYLPVTPVAGDGSYAWAVLDEGTKARFDLPAEETVADAAIRSSRLRAPSRTAAELTGAGAELRLDPANAARVVSFQQGELPTAKDLGPWFHDLTPWAASIPANVAAGGIKADLSRAFGIPSLPAELKGRYLYSGGSRALTAADPLFSNLAAFYQLHAIAANGRPLPVKTPARYRPLRGTSPNLAALDGNLLAPVVTRVSLVFSLISHEAHGHWGESTIASVTKDPNRKYMVYMIYTPVVTVYNPYNLPIVFSNLKLTFKNLPIGFKFYRNGVPQTNNFSLMSQFHVSSDNATPFEDPFIATVSSQAGVKASGANITLNPGEARVFGVNWPKGTTWGSMTNYLWQNDLHTSKTLDINAGPGWDYRTGFIVDWLRPQVSGRTADNGSLGVFAAAGSDRINVECTPMQHSSANGRFSVEIDVQQGSSSVDLGIYEYVYGNEKKLIEALENGNNPALGKVKFPFRREKDWNLNELYQPNYTTAPVEQWTGPKQFAVFTLTDRTALDSLYGTKPLRQSSFTHQVLQMDITKTHPAQMPMELSLLPIRTEGANTVGSIDADDKNRAYFFSGTRQLTGCLNFPTYQIPTSPLVNLADFRHANLASSGHLPLTAYTVGESLASPLVPPDKTRAGSSFGYEVADHAFLANQALWDGFYLSAIRNQSDAQAFFENGQLPLNPRFQPVLPPGQSAAEAAGSAVADSAWTSVAAMQLLKGGFNVNSTSVNAWKAVLGALSGTEIPVLDPLSLRERPLTGDKAPLPRLSRPVAGIIDGAALLDNQTRWGGFRNLNDAKLEALAKAIVEQVRQRGPFLSMSEFVNRRLAAEGDPTAVGGALEMAIRNSGINSGLPPAPVQRFVSDQEAQAFGYPNWKAAVGSTDEGAASNLSQGDLLSTIGTFVTVRSDTFTVRAYGDARDPSGKVLATAWCEAVVQRMPAFVDPSDRPDLVQAALGDASRLPDALKEANRKFGRRFEIVAFRWLAPKEV